MRVSQVSNNSLHCRNSLSFGAFITGRFMNGVLLNDVSARLVKATTTQEKEKAYNLTSRVFQKVKEIEAWDNSGTVIDIVPHSDQYKQHDVFDLIVSSFKNKQGKCLDGIGYSAVVRTFDSAQTSIADVFVNFSKKAYLRAKRPFIVSEAQKVSKANTDLSVLDSVKQRLGDDTFAVFKHEFFKLRKAQNPNVTTTDIHVN